VLDACAAADYDANADRSGDRTLILMLRCMDVSCVGTGRWVKAVEIIACLYGMETSWLFDPSVPLTEVFREHTGSLARQLVLSPARPCSRTR
jgi:hypothetical protein